VAGLLIHADSIRSPEMRHEVPVAVPDAFLYSERDGRRVAVVTGFEIPRIVAADPAIEALPPERFGIDELIASGLPAAEVELEVYLRACRELGVADAAVPATFPVELADHLRANGVALRVDREFFEDRRRSKNAAEVAGLRRAQRACEAALDVAREMLRRAEANGTLSLDGEPLTSERIKVEVERVFSEHGVAAEEFIVAHGAQTAVGHDMASRSSSTSSRATARAASTPT
jgi:Xaa-Pro aminopeptidase